MSDPLPLCPGERIDSLQAGGLRAIQDARKARLTTDSVLLADFARPARRDVACDLGTGTGVLPLLLWARAPGLRVDAVEIREDLADIAARNMKLNALQGNVTVHRWDLRRVRELLPRAAFSLVVANPPYHRLAEGYRAAEEKERSGADRDCRFEDVAGAAGWLLRERGRLCVCCPSGRFLHMADAMRGAGIEPKRIRFVASFCGRRPYLCLMEGLKGATRGLSVLPPLFIHSAPGVYTEELMKIYGTDGKGTGPGSGGRGGL